MDTDCIIHFKDKVLTKENKREFTEVTLKKFLDCRTDHTMHHAINHASCYQPFTNLSKLERAKNSIQQQNESVAKPLQSPNQPTYNQEVKKAYSTRAFTGTNH